MKRTIFGRSSLQVGLAVTVVGLLLALVASIFSTDTWWVRFCYVLGATASAAALAYQFVTGGPYRLEISPGDWKANGPEEMCILIPASKHGKGPLPAARLVLKIEEGFTEAGVDISYSKTGDVLVGIGGSKGLEARLLIS